MHSPMYPIIGMFLKIISNLAIVTIFNSEIFFYILLTLACCNFNKAARNIKYLNKKKKKQNEPFLNKIFVIFRQTNTFLFVIVNNSIVLTHVTPRMRQRHKFTYFYQMMYPIRVSHSDSAGTTVQLNK